MYDKTKGVEGYTVLVDSLEKKYSDPNTPQGEIRSLGINLHEAKRYLEIAKREEYEKNTQVSVYGSDDYVGASAGDTSFYFGYEVTKCPVKSHTDSEECYQRDCEKREWVFQVQNGGKTVFEMLDSELSYPQSDNIERKLIVGMAHYIKSLDQPTKEV